jgi:hypothetical protein
MKKFNNIRQKIDDPPTKLFVENLIKELKFNLSLCKRTSFDTDFNGSFYYEREWRCFDDFNFKKKDVGALIVPDNKVKDEPQSPQELVLNSNVYRDKYLHAPVIPWRLIEEL